MKKWSVALVAAIAIATLFGPWAYRQWQRRSAIANLRDGGADSDVHRVASEELVELGSAAIPALTRLLKDANFDVRGRAAGTLMTMKQPLSGEVCERLILIFTEQLLSGDFEARGEAAKSLSLLGRPLPEEAIDALMEAANNQEERRIRYETASRPYNALVRLGRPAVPALIRSLQSDNDDIRLQAMTALSMIGPEAEDAVPALIELLKNRRLSPTESRLDESGWMISSDAGAALASIGQPAIAALATALRDKREDVRFDAGSALARIGEPAVPTLIEALRDEQVEVRLEAARALERIGPPATRAVPSLIAALKDDTSPPHLVSLHAAQALGQIGKEQAIPALVEMLEEEDVHLRTHAAEALHILDWEKRSRLLEVLINALDHDVARVCAARTLGSMGPDAQPAIPKLLELSEANDIDAAYCHAVSRALKKIELAGDKH